MAVVLREVEHTDFSQIRQLFVDVYGKQPSSGFERAFFDHSPLLGYCLMDDSTKTGVMVGFFGCFSYTRTIEGTSYKFYNSHTWIVKEDYRKHSLKLLLPYIKLKDGIITNFSANGKVAQILEQLKFTKLRIVNYVLKPSFRLGAVLKGHKIEAFEVDNAVLNAHRHYDCLCLSLRIAGTKETVDVILKSVIRKPKWVEHINGLSKSLLKKPLITKRYFLYKVHYVSDTSCFHKHLHAIKHFLFLKHKVGGLILPELLIEHLPTEQIITSYEDEIYVKVNEDKLPGIDYLYSEVFYLNILDK